MTLEEIITQARSEGGLDVSEDQAKAWFLTRYKRMVAEAKWRMAEVAVATTVADQAVYPLSEDIVDLEGLLVGDVPYSRISTKELWQLKVGWRQRVGSGGLFAPQFGADAARSIELYPAPENDGDAITGLAALEPPDISTSASPDVPTDLHEYLVDGIIAVGLARIEERQDSAKWHEDRYAEGVELLRRRKNSRIGSGPVAIRVGYP